MKELISKSLAANRSNLSAGCVVARHLCAAEGTPRSSRLASGSKYCPLPRRKIPKPVPELIIATGNLHKVEEISAILKGLPLKIIALPDLPRPPKVVEDCDTLEGNSAKKAREVALRYGKWALADDTGLFVDLLNGEPGVYSARWAGRRCTYADNNRKLLKKLDGVPRSKRTASFRCVIALASPSGRTWTVEGSIGGVIAGEIKGSGGFGYDPLFYVPRCRKTFAELSAKVKNTISHRARALRKARRLIRTHLGI